MQVKNRQCLQTLMELMGKHKDEKLIHDNDDEPKINALEIDVMNIESRETP